MSDVFDELRAAILRGEYAPLQRLIETELVERYGTTRFVLRNALTRLATEGMVELQPNRGGCPSPPTRPRSGPCSRRQGRTGNV